MKRTILALFVCVLALLALSGCGASAVAAREYGVAAYEYGVTGYEYGVTSYEYALTGLSGYDGPINGGHR